MNDDVTRISKELKIALIAVIQTGYFTRSQRELACKELEILTSDELMAMMKELNDKL